ncbi:hypothetical protein SDC9_96874 [bioreactor metagenome]|uniref:Uncharacterized protein n=1 Tax=bioreactor metagenome TaxID=1076179 RepID=A0A645AA99_9ZZZZ
MGGQVIHADDVSASSLGFFSLGTLGEHSHAGGLAGAVRQHDGATHHLVRLLGIHAELHSNVDGLVELGGSGFLHQGHSVSERVQLGAVHLAGQCFLLLGQLCHDYSPSTVTPMERAEPAKVRTAASTLAAFMSFNLVLAISSS